MEMDADATGCLTSPKPDSWSPIEGESPNRRQEDILVVFDPVGTAAPGTFRFWPTDTALRRQEAST
jgi:hypothetical protein